MQDNIHIALKQYEDKDKLEQLHIERERTEHLDEFKKWMREMKIGTRIVVNDKKAEAINAQYDFRKLKDAGPSYLPAWVKALY